MHKDGLIMIGVRTLKAREFSLPVFGMTKFGCAYGGTSRIKYGQFITSDGKNFMTSDGNSFNVKI